jgi:hypothetical protein
MQKIYIISCCAECPAYKLRMDRLPHCEKEGRRIKGDSSNPVNFANIGFPEWCPLESMEMARGKNHDYKKEVTQIMCIMEDSFNQDAILEASHYLNKVIEDAKKKAETN